MAGMENQLSFAHAEYAGKKKTTRRERFLGEMERVVPWLRLVALIEPYYPSGQRGRPPIGIERMLRIYFLQQWYSLADEALEDALFDSQAMRTFAGIDLSVEAVPDATTLLKFRHLLERHQLPLRIFEEVGALLSERKLLMKEGTIVDATIIAAPSSTKNQGKQRHRHGGQRGRHRTNPCPAARQGAPSLCRRRLPRSGKPPGDGIQSEEREMVCGWQAQQDQGDGRRAIERRSTSI